MPTNLLKKTTTKSSLLHLCPVTTLPSNWPAQLANPLSRHSLHMQPNLVAQKLVPVRPSLQILKKLLLNCLEELNQQLVLNSK
jgi:hypothetical protein